MSIPLSKRMLQVGDRIPPFTLVDQDDNPVTERDLFGRWSILYFYPKDDTPGCTTEACSFRDAFPRFEAAGVQVLGVSSDSPVSHKRFAKKYGLPYTLVSDPDRLLQEKTGIWTEKKIFGKPVRGAARVTFIIDPAGIVRAAYPQVQPAGHADEVREKLRLLQERA